MSQRKPGDALFTTLAATAAIAATLITLWIGRGIARMSHGGGAAHEAASAEGAAHEEAH
jgi:hypothetical protein